VTDCPNPKLAPHGKLPYLKIQGTPISGCKDILTFLKADVDLDSDLSDHQVSLVAAYTSLIQNTCQDALLYNWYFESDNYAKSIRSALFSNISFLARYSVPLAISAHAKQRLEKYHVHSKENNSEVYSRAKAAYKALDSLLGEKDFFFGSSPSSLDAIAFGYLILHCLPSLSKPNLYAMMALDCPRLLTYLHRVKDLCFSKDLERTPSRLSNSRLFWEEIILTPRRIYSKITDYFERQTPEERVNQFYTWLSVLGSISFFGLYVKKIGLIEFEDEEDDD
jgi:metaxin